MEVRKRVYKRLPAAEGPRAGAAAAVGLRQEHLRGRRGEGRGRNNLKLWSERPNPTANISGLVLGCVHGRSSEKRVVLLKSHKNQFGLLILDP